MSMEKLCSITECSRPHYGRSWCRRHWRQWSKTGDPVGFSRRTSVETRELIATASQAPVNDCIIMPSPKGIAPSTRFQGRKTLAARAVWITAHGDPGDLLVLHSCSEGSGTSGCININHLYLGTAKQNAADKMAAGRWVKGKSRSIISEAQVAQIRTHYAMGCITQAELGKLHGICRTAVGAIVRGENWKN